MWLILISAGIIVNKHYSNGQLYSTSFYVEAASCCEQEIVESLESCCSMEEAEVESCCSEPEEVFETVCCDNAEEHREKGCCDQESELIQLDVNYFPSEISRVEKAISPVNTFILSQLLAFTPAEVEIASVKFYGTSPPPLLVPKRLSLFQTYLI